MSPLDAKGIWGTLASRLYDRVVASGQDDLYRRMLAEVARGARGGDVLDLGCGPGHAALMFAAEHPSARVTGADASPEMVAIANRHAARAGIPNVSFVVGDAQALPFADRSFDRVYSIASIKHWPRPEAGLAEIHRVLRPGGSVGIVEADRGARDEAVLAHARRWRFPPPAFTAPWFRAFIAGRSLDAREARELAKRSPLDAVSMDILPDLPFFVIRAERRADEPRASRPLRGAA